MMSNVRLILHFKFFIFWHRKIPIFIRKIKHVKRQFFKIKAICCQHLKCGHLIKEVSRKNKYNFFLVLKIYFGLNWIIFSNILFVILKICK